MTLIVLKRRTLTLWLDFSYYWNSGFG